MLGSIVDFPSVKQGLVSAFEVVEVHRGSDATVDQLFIDNLALHHFHQDIARGRIFISHIPP